MVYNRERGCNYGLPYTRSLIWNKALNIVNRFAMPSLLLSKKPTLSPRSTFLYHFDISSNNIIVNKEGIPIALLDWE